MRHSKFFPGAPKSAILSSLYRREEAYFFMQALEKSRFFNIFDVLKKVCISVKLCL